MLVCSGQVAAPKRRRPLRVMALKDEIISTQALREPEKLVGVSGRFAQASGGHRVIVEAPQRLELRRAVFARLESHGAAIDRMNLRCPVPFTIIRAGPSLTHNASSFAARSGFSPSLVKRSSATEK